MYISSSVRFAFAGSLALLGTTASRVASQTLGGQVVRIDSKQPLAGAAVALVNDSAQVVASASASGDGAFYLDAPAAGAYRLVVLVAGASFVSPAVKLDSGKTIEKQFSVPDVPESFASALFARDVTTPASAVPGSPRPAYPAALAAQGARALVSTMFVVDEDGRANVESFRALNTAADPFIESIRDALKRTRFVPAQKDGGPVRQVVQYTYDFGMRGDPERGDVVVRPAAATPPAPAKAAGPKTLYVIGADELSAPGIEQMNLVDALNHLRALRLEEQHHAGRAAGVRQRRARRGARIPARPHGRPGRGGPLLEARGSGDEVRDGLRLRHHREAAPRTVLKRRAVRRSGPLSLLSTGALQ